MQQSSNDTVGEEECRAVETVNVVVAGVTEIQEFELQEKGVFYDDSVSAVLAKEYGEANSEWYFFLIFARKVHSFNTRE